MRDPIQKARYLSEPQNRRFAGLFTIALGYTPYDSILETLVMQEYAYVDGDNLKLTEKGNKELHRLAFFCGVLITSDDPLPLRLSYVDPDN